MHPPKSNRTLTILRYDRVYDEEKSILIRFHQEDTCQALGFFPRQKHQSDGGPSAPDIVGLLRDHSSDADEDIDRFICALAFNWFVCGTDAHSKNYSLIHGPGGFLRLAPIYDVASFLPYERDPKSTKLKMAMKIGNAYRIHRIGASDWTKWAGESGLDGQMTLAWVKTIVEAVGNALEASRKAADPSGDSKFIDGLTKLVSARIDTCSEALGM